MQLEEECKNTENNVAVFKFNKENKILELNLDVPNFSEFVNQIVINNYDASEDNLEVTLKSNKADGIDVNELKNIVIEIHKQYLDEISMFYNNINKEIKTYYSDDTELIYEIKKYIEESTLKKEQKNPDE